ncbi:MAG: hypothetical protein OEW68_05545 [Gammaproteobacteria bacterium]|nr:hypothetical protein [Gammaproteobacteria bacterium]MDH4314289.1 hypothetical protein [Gammaproteobacteria bacterium]MDH5212761.1 hypothetical protein [Gammaproteobacteria bacterium]MDH5501075.1 hypothetical protein [Gammaproteobacteria bacterium]
MIRIALATLALTAAPALADSPAENWSLEVGKDPVSWENVATLTTESSIEIANEYATKQVRPLLIFQCRPGGDGSVSVRVDWQRFISSFNTEVGFKADEKDLLLVNWGVDKSNRITQPRGASDSRELLAYLKGAIRLQVEVIPYSASLLSVNFDVSGIDTALATLIAKCSG